MGTRNATPLKIRMKGVGHLERFFWNGICDLGMFKVNQFFFFKMLCFVMSRTLFY